MNKMTITNDINFNQKVHTLKTWPEYFALFKSGHKTFELRKNDRDFQPGDILILREWEPIMGYYTGYAITKMVSHVLFDAPEFGLQPGFCIMSFADLKQAGQSMQTNFKGKHHIQ